MPAALWQILEETSLVVLPTPLFLTDIRAFLGLLSSCFIFLPPLYPVHRSLLVEAFFFKQDQSCPRRPRALNQQDAPGPLCTVSYILYRTFWYFMILSDPFWDFLVLYAIFWYFMILSDHVWNFLVLYATFWYSMMLFGT